MYQLYVAVTLVTIVANGFFTVADLLPARFVVANSAEVGVLQSSLPILGLLKGAGAIGLLLGLLDVRWIGVSAAVGLVGFFTGAVAVHIRARVFHNIAFPVAMWLLTVCNLALVLLRP